ncbi:ABC transporter permease [Patulibacter sp. NPDC049589]|uniref:branched-chain amino acid ABC transporter permease n=1 Tax=Patulibacter sp. NPDC049589 TaxID=3154731 RepID=UPI00341AE9DA
MATDAPTLPVEEPTKAPPAAPTEPGPRAAGRRPQVKHGAWAVIAVLAIVLLANDTQAIQSLLLGAGSGSLIAALALGVVVTYRGSGVINIATGAMAMYATYVFNALNTDGKLLVIGWKVDIGGPVGFIPALIITVAVAAIWGGLLYRVIFAPLRTASPVAKVVASVGLLLVIQSVIVLAFTATPVPIKATLSADSVKLPADIVVPVNQLILCGAVIVAATALWAIYRFTGFGLATRAAAEDERHLVLLGHSPTIVSGGNWVFSGIVVALFAVLAAPVNGTADPTTTTLLVVPALAAALVGRFTSFGVAAAAGLAIGMLQALIQYLGTKGWYPQSAGSPIPGVAETVPLAIILVVLAFQRKGLPSRGSLGNVRLPFSPTPRHVGPKLIAGLVVGIGGFLVLGPTWRLAEVNSVVGIAICLSFVILIGFVGQVSLAQMALAGFAGFAMAKLSSSAGIGFPFAPILGALSAAVVGVLAALPALRLRGVQLAVVTMAAAVAIQSLVFKNPDWAGGLRGAVVSPPKLFGQEFGPITPTSLGDGQIPNPWFGIFCVLVVVALAGLTSLLRSSGLGRRMLAVRANERSAAAAGISVRQTKIAAFGISAFVAGLAGALSGYRFGSVTPDYFGVFASLSFLAFAYMGGISSVTGAVIGGLLVTNGLVFTALREWVGLGPDYAVLVGGLGLVLTVVANPDGIAGQTRIFWEQFKRRRASGPPASREPGGPVAAPPSTTVQEGR